MEPPLAGSNLQQGARVGRLCPQGGKGCLVVYASIYKKTSQDENGGDVEAAEIGSAFLCADLGLIPKPREDHADYINSWLKALKNDKQAIVIAAGHTQKAVDFL